MGNAPRLAVLRLEERQGLVRDVFPAQPEQLARPGARDERQGDQARSFFGARLEQSPLFVGRQDPRAPVVHLQPLDAARRRVDQLAPLDGLRQDRLRACRALD